MEGGSGARPHDPTRDHEEKKREAGNAVAGEHTELPELPRLPRNPAPRDHRRWARPGSHPLALAQPLEVVLAQPLQPPREVGDAGLPEGADEPAE